MLVMRVSLAYEDRVRCRQGEWSLLHCFIVLNPSAVCSPRGRTDDFRVFEKRMKLTAPSKAGQFFDSYELQQLLPEHCIIDALKEIILSRFVGGSTGRIDGLQRIGDIARLHLRQQWIEPDMGVTLRVDIPHFTR